MNRIDKDTIATEILNITILIVGYFIYKNFNIQNIFQLCLFICYQICLFMFLNKRSYFRYFFKNLVYIFYGVLLIKILNIILRSNQLFDIKELFYIFLNGTIIYFIKYLIDYIVNKKYRIIKYNGFTYDVPVIDKLKILHIKGHLLYLRFLRNAHRVFLYLTTTFIVLFLWIIFIVVLSYSKKNNLDIDIIFKMAYKNISSIFTSCILVAFTTIYKENSQYRINLKKQYNLYYDFLYESDVLIKYLLSIDEDEGMVLMTKTTISYYCNRVKERGQYIYIFDDEIVISFKNVLNQIKDMINQEQIYYWKKEYEFMLDEIDGVFKIVSKRESSTDDVLTLLTCMSWLIYYLRIPWRRDYKENQKIRRIIAQYNDIYAYPDNVFLKDTDSSIG